jgi:LytS/YehU family sensor histidine kinase
LEQLRYNPPEQTGRPPGPPPAQTMRERARYGIIIALPYARVIGYMSSSLFMVFLSLGVRVLERQSKILKMQEELQKATLNAELSILKNQISPHFFFNTLNNIYSLIGRNNEDSKNAVVKLSKLMRYVLNESGKDFKLLSEEIEFMSNYVDLMKLRMGAKTRLTVNFPSEFKNILIPHLLFISLIENAFKYGISVQEESYISISLETAGNSILFKCENGLPESNSGTIFESSGIGLENLKKRLSLLYPGRHVLEINRDNTKFEVNLNIQM